MTKLKTKSNGVYYLDTLVPDGSGALRRSRVGLDTKDREEAERQHRDWMAGIHPKHPAQGGIVAPKGALSTSNTSGRATLDGPSVSQWLNRCLSEKEVWLTCRADATHRSNVRKLIQYLPDGLALRDLNSSVVEELRETLETDGGYAPASVHKLLTALSAACRFAVEKGELAAMPRFKMPSYENQRERVLTLDEQAVLIECLAARRRAESDRKWWHMEKLILLLLETGCRKTEMLLAGPSWVKRKRWIDPMTGEVIEGVFLGIPRRTIYQGREIVVTKNKKPRDVPLSTAAQELVAQLTERAEDTRFWPWRIGTSAPTYFLQNLRDDMRERGYNIDDVVLHTMRHTCATRLAEGGMDLIALKDWLGHSDIQVTAQRYIHLMNSHVHRGVAILDAYGSGASGNRSGNRKLASDDSSMVDHRSAGTDRAEGVTQCHH